MIERERLKELIKQNAMIWHIVGKNIFNPNASDVPIFYTLSDENWDIRKDEYFETEEDARWDMEMSATYTDTLKLANYTNFENENGDRVFYHKGITYELSLWWASDNTKIIRLTWSSRDGFGCYFEKPLTKQNYIEACKLCLRLLRGE